MARELIMAGVGGFLKGVVKGFLNQFLGGLQISGVDVGDLIIAVLAYYFYNTLSGDLKWVMVGLFVSAFASLVENLVGGGLSTLFGGSSGSSTQSNTQSNTISVMNYNRPTITI